ncbi:MAG: response regulator [Proteobacteria bacterium]|nr:response regulator [Pseudomonadota bacterium]
MTNHILIVEDDEMVQKFVALHLENEGFQTSTATTGAGALAILADQAIDLILLDLNLPDGDGLSIAQKVRETSTVPIIILTARKGQDDRMLGLGLGADEYLTKPIAPEELFLRVRNLLSRAVSAPQPPSPGFAPAKPESPPAQPAAPAPNAAPAPTAAPNRGGLGLIAGIAALIAVVSGGAVWYFDQSPQPPKSPAPSSLPGPIKPEPEPKQTPKPQSKAKPLRRPAPAALAEEEHTKAIAEVLGYGWALQSKCDPLPDVKWWKYNSHESIASYVLKSQKGDWAAYTKIWFLRLVRLHEIDNRNSSAVTSSGVVLKGDALKDYIKKMQKRLAVIKCLAAEAKAFAAKR